MAGTTSKEKQVRSECSTLACELAESVTEGNNKFEAGVEQVLVCKTARTITEGTTCVKGVLGMLGANRKKMRGQLY